MLWQIALLTILVVVIWDYLLKRKQSSLEKLPGPPRLPIVGSAFYFIGYSNRQLFEKMMEMRKLYGGRILIKVFNRYVLHIYDVKDIEAVLSHSRNITKNIPYRFLEPWLGGGLLLSTGSKWHRRRKILTPSFHFNILKNFSKVMEEKSEDMVEKLKERVKNDSDVVELMPFISDCTLYTICETAMGTQLDSDKSTASVEYKREILNIGNIIMQRLTRFWLHMNFIFNISSYGKRFAKSLNVVHSFSDQVILERKMKRQKEHELPNLEDDLGSKRRLALLDFLLEAESKGEIDLEGIREEVNTFMFEGHDTTAMALTFGLMLLADHEEVQERIFEECQNIFGDSNRTPTVADQAEMKYLEAVIKETLRLYPSVPFVGRQLTEDLVLDNNLVAIKGTEVLVRIYDLHRNEEIYPDPEAFKPERFLGTSETRHPYAFVPFSAGPRNCIGQRFAMQEMKCMLSQILRNFKLAPIKKGARPALKADLVLRPCEPIYVKFIAR